MTFSREAWSDAFAKEILPLNRAHHNEVACFKDINLEPDWAQYALFQASGCMRIFTARQNGILMGYSFFFVKSAPHYKGSLQAVADLLYLAPNARKGFDGYAFMRWCDDQLKAECVEVVYQNVTHAGPDFGKLLERMGYSAIEAVYARRLNR